MTGAMSCAANEREEHNSVPSPYLFGRISNREYREAVAQVVRDVKAERKLSNERMAEQLGVSESTIFNAENENGNLDAVTLLNIAVFFGGERAIGRVLALANGNPDKTPTTGDRLENIEREVAAIRREMQS